MTNKEQDVDSLHKLLCNNLQNQVSQYLKTCDELNIPTRLAMTKLGDATALFTASVLSLLAEIVKEETKEEFLDGALATIKKTSKLLIDLNQKNIKAC